MKIFRRYFKKWRERTREPGLTALLIIEASLIFIIVPLTGMGAIPSFILPATFVLLVIAILVVTSRTHSAAIAVLVAVALSPFGVFVHREHPSVITEWLSAGGRLLAIAAVSIVIARAVFGGGRVTPHRIQGAIVLYLNFALFFFIIYQFIAVIAPDAFEYNLPSGPDHDSHAALLLNFSFATLTPGYGDVTPVHPFARSLASLESVIGQLYPATLLARLVSLELEQRRQVKSD